MSSFRQLMMRNKGGSGDIPTQYTVVDWIQFRNSPDTDNNVNCYIDTGIVLNYLTQTYLKAKFILYNPMVSNAGQFGTAFGVEGSQWVDIRCSSWSSKGTFAFFSNEIQPNMVSGQVTDIEVKNRIATINGSDINLGTAIQETSGSRTLTLFCVHGSNFSYQGNMRLYEFKLGSSEDNLIIDYVPVYDTVTQKYGVYDRATQMFKTNSKSGSNLLFSGGND